MNVEKKLASAIYLGVWEKFPLKLWNTEYPSIFFDRILVNISHQFLGECRTHKSAMQLTLPFLAWQYCVEKVWCTTFELWILSPVYYRRLHPSSGLLICSKRSIKGSPTYQYCGKMIRVCPFLQGGVVHSFESPAFLIGFQLPMML